MQTFIAWYVQKRLDHTALSASEARALCGKAANEFNRLHFASDAGLAKRIEGWASVWVQRERDRKNNLASRYDYWETPDGRQVLVYEFENRGKPKPEAEAVLVL
jgi:hypothetical protein